MWDINLVEGSYEAGELASRIFYLVMFGVSVEIAVGVVVMLM